MLRILGRQNVRQLWSGQLLSSVGDQLFEVALVWFAAQLLGHGAGYIVAVQAGSIFVFSLIGGYWSDRWDEFSTMINVDIIRGLAVLSLVAVGLSGTVTVLQLVGVTLVVASCKAFFEPALKASFPMVVPNTSLQQIAALMGMTHRLGMIIGPGLAGILGKFMPIIHYFTVDALSFFISAWSIKSVAKNVKRTSVADAANKRARAIEAITGGFRLVRRSRFFMYVMLSGALVNACWVFTFPMAIGILLHERYPGDVSALSLVVGAYGIGNVVTNLVLGSVHMRKLDQWLYGARILAGFGFSIFALSPNFSFMLIAAAFAAIAGPIADLAVINLMQERYTPKEIVKVHRLSMMLTYASLLVVLLGSPLVFKLFSVQYSIVVVAIVIASLGIVGAVAFQDRKARSSPMSSVS